MGFWSDAWDAVTDAAETVWDGVTTAGGAIVSTLELLAAPFGIILAMTIGWITAIPILGPLIKWIINLVTMVVWYIVGVVDLILSLIGIRPEKKMRVAVICLSDSKGPMASDTDILHAMDTLSKTFKERSNIRIINTKPAQYTTPFGDVKSPSADWISHPDASSEDILQGECDSAGLGADLGTDGSRLEALSLLTAPWSYIRRLLGYGSPVFIFIIRDFSDPTKNGCSNAPFTDYVQISGAALKPNTSGVVVDKYIIAHECGHACNLTHSIFGSAYGISNLMYPEQSRTNDELTNWQISFMRQSRHVTYF